MWSAALCCPAQVQVSKLAREKNLSQRLKQRWFHFQGWVYLCSCVFQVLLTMAKSADHRRHLNHPVISSFLALKWSRISFLYNINIVFVFLMVAILTSYIFANYAGPSLDVASPLCFADLNATERLSEGVSRSPHGNDLTLRILLIVLLAVLSGRELIQFMVAPVKHLKSFENILEILLIVLLR